MRFFYAVAAAVALFIALGVATGALQPSRLSESMLWVSVGLTAFIYAVRGR